MKKLFCSVIALTALTFGAKADLVSDAIKAIQDFDALKTPLAVSTMAKDDNVGMEVFRANGLKGDLYTGGYGVNIRKEGGLLGITNTMVVEGFYYGNFDLTVKYVAAMLPEATLTPRATKPDGTPAEYTTATEAKIVPCLVIKNFIYVPLEVENVNIPLFGYVSNADPSGLDNLHFNAVTMPNIAESIAELIPADLLAKIIKAAVDSQLQNETIRNLVGKVIDGIIGDGSDPAKYLSLLDGAKVNAFRIVVDGKTVDTFNGYELHTIKSNAVITDRIITDIKGDNVPLMGYGVKADTDLQRTYKIAYTIDADNRMYVYNFNNAGMALHSEVVKGEDNVRRYVTTLSPVTGTLDFASGLFTLDNHQQLGATPTLMTETAGGIFNSQTITQLWPVGPYTLFPNSIHPDWDAKKGVESTASLGKPSHTGNRWHIECGGSLVTMSDNAEIAVGDYCPASGIMDFNGNITPGRTTNGPIVYDTKWTITGVKVDPITHNVGIDLKYNLEDGEKIFGTAGINLWGTYHPGDHPEYVESYQLYLVPDKIEDVSKPYESLFSNPTSAYQHSEGCGIQYRAVSGVKTSDWSDAVCASDYAAGTPKTKAVSVEGNTFSHFIPYTEITKYTPKKILGWEKEHAGSGDNFTVFVKTNYTAESGLQPTFHALTALDKSGTTGVEDITGDGTARVSGGNGVITVTGSEGAQVTVYTLQGIKVGEADGDTSFTVAPGTYVVTVGSAATKVIVR